jgi:hypothetical protein
MKVQLRIGKIKESKKCSTPPKAFLEERTITTEIQVQAEALRDK